MRSRLEVLLFTGSLVAASFGATASATAATPPAPTLITSNFVCGNGVCQVGPGNVGMAFAAGLDGIGGPAYYGPECNAFTMKVISGSLPPGLQFGEPDCEWTITGTPTQAGTYAFTVQITPQPNNLGQPAGPSGTQQLTITIGTGNSDRLVVRSATYNGHQFRLYVDGYDVNISASYSVRLTSTGKVLIPAQPNTGLADNGFLALTAHLNDPCGANNSCNLTVTDNLGSSVTVTLPPAKY
jgi:hypothetical protein